MRSNWKLVEAEPAPSRTTIPGVLHRLAAIGNDEDGDPGEAPDQSPTPRSDDLPYKVELWDKSKSTVEQVLAVTRNGSIGYAAYYEATRQFPDRYIVLRHKGRILSRFNGPAH